MCCQFSDSYPPKRALPSTPVRRQTAQMILAEAPKITDWMQGWGSVVGVAASIAAVGVTGYLLRHELLEARRARADATEERAAAAEDREAARLDRLAASEERRASEMDQARTVVLQNSHRSVADGRLISAGCEVANYGPAPILDVLVEMIGKDGSGEVDVQLGHFPILPPGPKGWKVSVRPDLPVAGDTDGDLSIVLTFTDATGRRWLRRDNGQPVPVVVVNKQAEVERRLTDGEWLTEEDLCNLFNTRRTIIHRWTRHGVLVGEKRYAFSFKEKASVRTYNPEDVARFLAAKRRRGE